MFRLQAFEKLLLALIVFIVSLITIRIIYSGSLLFIFLIWNIFLAWIPFWLSSYLTRFNNYKKGKQLLLFGFWLLFFPNALYIITDLVHLDLETNIPKWFDTIILFTSSVVGLMLAFISLYRIEKYLHQIVGKKMLTLLIIMILFLGSFGVYLGRFLRWNSWNIISKPYQLFSSIGHQIIFPFEHWHTWIITSILTVLFYLLYFSIKKLPGYLSQANI